MVTANCTPFVVTFQMTISDGGGHVLSYSFTAVCTTTGKRYDGSASFSYSADGQATVKTKQVNGKDCR